MTKDFSLPTTKVKEKFSFGKEFRLEIKNISWCFGLRMEPIIIYRLGIAMNKTSILLIEAQIKMCEKGKRRV